MAVISAKVRMLLQYRAAAIAGFTTQAFFGLVAIMYYQAFYDSSTATQPISLRQVVSYIWLGQAMLAMLPWNSDPEVRSIIRSGAVAYELLRPIDLYNLWYCRAVAMRTAPAMLRGVPMFAFAAILMPLMGLGDWSLHLPQSWQAAGAFGLSMMGALLLSCAVTMLVNLSLLWSVGGDGVSTLLAAMVTIFSGMVIPLPLFPGWLQSTLAWLPFAGIADTPYRLYTGNYPASDMWLLLARQIVWVVVLVVLGRWLVRRAARQIVVQGG